MRLLATYPSSHAALRAERELKSAGRDPELIPVPRQIRSTCGFCLLLAGPEAGPALRATTPEALWRILEPDPEHPRRRYEPCP